MRLEKSSLQFLLFIAYLLNTVKRMVLTLYWQFKHLIGQLETPDGHEKSLLSHESHDQLGPPVGQSSLSLDGQLGPRVKHKKCSLFKKINEKISFSQEGRLNWANNSSRKLMAIWELTQAKGSLQMGFLEKKNQVDPPPLPPLPPPRMLGNQKLKTKKIFILLFRLFWAYWL